MINYYSRSVEIILANQHSSGAYVASPAFANYHYCWLRDGSFIAYAMDRAGEHQSAEAFFRWVDRAVNRYSFKVTELEEQLAAGSQNIVKNILHTRYTLDGEEEESDSKWGNFQIDGYGTWLWALAEHVRMTHSPGLLTEFADSIKITLRYLKAAWQLPNYDCWEEHPEYLHPYSLSAVYGGLKAIEDLISAGQFDAGNIPIAETAIEIKEFLTKYAVVNGTFVKHIWPPVADKSARPVINSSVDSSLLGVVVPYRTFTLNDPVFRATAAVIETNLHRTNGGVYRYKEDVYYGGGEWLLLTAWLGWYYVLIGKRQEAEILMKWIENNTDSKGNMPEQVNDHVLKPNEFQPWVNRWGKVASPLLWSHAMYLILAEELK